MLGRGEMQAGDHAGQAAIHLFWPGRVDVAGAQARFHMANRYPLVIRGEAGRKGRGSIAVNENDIRAPLAQHAAHACQYLRGDIGKVLARGHQVQVEIGGERKQAQHLVQHLPVLGGHADLDVDIGRFGQYKR